MFARFRNFQFSYSAQSCRAIRSQIGGIRFEGGAADPRRVSGTNGPAGFLDYTVPAIVLVGTLLPIGDSGWHRLPVELCALLGRPPYLPTWRAGSSVG
jgi:hypothetical protein